MAEAQTEIVETPPSGGKKKLILFSLIGAAVIAAVVAIGMTIMKPDVPAADDIKQAIVAAKVASPIYQGLQPPLVVNFKDEFGDSRFMQITMEVMTRKQSVANAIREHTPAIRNALILLYSGPGYADADTRAGKQRMLTDGREEIARVLAEVSGEQGVEALYFTDLIIQ